MANQVGACYAEHGKQGMTTRRMNAEGGAIAVERSGNKKLSSDDTCSATSVAQASCPTSCAFRGTTEGDAPIAPLALAQKEAGAIRKLSGKYPLRLHAVGDASSPWAARTVAQAAKEHTAKHGQAVWSYTHAWRDVAPSNWEGVSILASCETLEQVGQARAKGYATAVVVQHHTDDGKAWVADNGQTIVPCPNQTRKVTCVECRLCWRADWLRDSGRTIAFAIHGPGAKRARTLVWDGGPVE